MGRLALVGGHGFGSLTPWAGASRIEAGSDRGSVELIEAANEVVLERHAADRYTPAHLVDHARNLGALRDAGCNRVLAICSVGSLSVDLEVGSFLCPDDFIALGRIDAAFDDERGHIVPGFDPVWRRLVLEAWKSAAEAPIRDGGVYWQSPGPRFETPAEVRLIASHADVVGMTMASECTIASQLGLAYAAICVIDNLANGIASEALTNQAFEAGRDANRVRLEAALTGLLPLLGDEAR
jgi:5'-methylthioadenosine phosphorylase